MTYCNYEDTDQNHIKTCKTCGKSVNTLVMALTRTRCCQTLITPKQTYQIAPYNGSCLGINAVKPQDYTVSVVIPVLETVKPLKTVVDLLQLQTIKPYIMIIDTGSTKNIEAIECLRCENVEVHYIRSHGWQHPSQPVSVAQDLAMAMCRTRFLFNTHADCFLKRRDLLEDWVMLCEKHKIVGYQISPRSYNGWEKEFGHTALMVDHHYCLQHNITWNMSKYAYDRNAVLKPNLYGPNCPDTESQFNASKGDVGLFIGDGEENMKRNVNEDFDHPRSYCCSSIYNSKYHEQIAKEMDLAIKEAKERIKLWKQHVGGRVAFNRDVPILN